MLNISKFVEEIATLWNRLDEFTFQNSLPFAEAVLQTSFFQTACWLTEIIRVRLSKFFSSIMPSIFNKVNLFLQWAPRDEARRGIRARGENFNTKSRARWRPFVKEREAYNKLCIKGCWSHKESRIEAMVRSLDTRFAPFGTRLLTRFVYVGKSILTRIGAKLVKRFARSARITTSYITRTAFSG